MSDFSSFPVVISDEALAHIKRMLTRKAKEGQIVRLGVKGGGCSGFEYVIRLDDQTRPNDLTLEHEGLSFACDPKSAALLQGSTLIYTGNLINGSLKFENPNASRSCGCGTSFTPSEDK